MFLVEQISVASCQKKKLSYLEQSFFFFFLLLLYKLQKKCSTNASIDNDNTKFLFGILLPIMSGPMTHHNATKIL